MLISCTSCKSKYLVNSAELKPNGRNVQCVSCGNQWYQDANLIENDQIEEIIFTKNSTTSIENAKNENKSSTQNLPSTYVKEKKISIINSFLVVLFVIIFMGGFLFFKQLEINSLVLFKYYMDEFIFNLKLISNDIARILHQIFN